MSAQPTRTQKPLLLPGIAPHLFQSRTPTHLQRKMSIKITPEGPVMDHDHSRTPSDGSTVAAPTLKELQAALQDLRRHVESSQEDLRRRVERSQEDLRRRIENSPEDLRRRVENSPVVAIAIQIDNAWIPTASSSNDDDDPCVEV
ncbi:hypothetical protein B0H13DRAFT_2368175 [Mycena leptocephala]|nr:hypothetical protein B0H13DRAFT_2368175 [Mycena leptocephala]